jgi:hypothetical protein
MDKSTEPFQDVEICQCPKCLEVQERSEVCIKCGLIFKKYHSGELSLNSHTHIVNTDDEVERMDPRVEKFMNKSALIYLLTAALISIFDIGNFEFSKLYCEVVKSLVPSLYGTSIISKDPNNTCLILALSWIWPIVTAGLMINWVIKQLVNGSVTHILPQGKLFAQILALLFVMAVVAGLYYTPFSTHVTGRHRIIYMLMRDWAFASALWGTAIYYMIVVMLITVISLVLEFIDKWGK